MATGQVEYIFSGFEGELADLNGNYSRTADENHGRPVLKKMAQGQEVMVYFWDDRDGPQLQGWWVAPEVGGANVWAMNPPDPNCAEASREPPMNGWKVPWHGDVDPKVVCTRANQGAAPGMKRPADASWNQYQAGPKATRWGQQGTAGWNNQQHEASPPAQPAANQWGQKGGSVQPAGQAQPWQQNLIGGAAGQAPQRGGQGAWNQGKSQWDQQNNQWGGQQQNNAQPGAGANRLQEIEAKRKQAQEDMRRAEQEAKTLRQEEETRRREAETKRKMEEKLRVGVQQASISVTNAEKKFAAAKDNAHSKLLFNGVVNGKDPATAITPITLRTNSDELDKLIKMALSTINGTKTSIEQRVTELADQPPSTFVKSLQNQLTGFQTRCERALENTQALEGQKSERVVLLWSQVGESNISECEKEVAEVEKHVEVLKDAAALLTSDLADHLTPEATLEATKETDAALKTATTTLQNAHRTLQAKQKELLTCPKKMQDKVAELMRRMTPWNQEINQLRKTSMEATRKANVQMEQRKRKEEEMKKQRKIKRTTEWNKQLVEDISVECMTAQLALQMSTFADAEALVQAAEKTYNDYIKKPCLPQTKAAIQRYEQNVRDLVAQTEKKKKCTFKGDSEFRVAAALNEYMRTNKRSPGDIFRMLSRNTGHLTLKGFQMFCKGSLKTVSADQIAEAWARVDILRPNQGKLTQEEFATLCEMHLEVETSVPFTKEEEATEEEMGAEGKMIPAGRYVLLMEVGKSLGTNDVVRVKVKDCATEEVGWITIFDDVLFVRQCLFYKCTKETVLTEGADMKGLKVVRRIKLGEILRFIMPTATGLIGRIKVQCTSDSKIGYITAINTDNNTVYLCPEKISANTEENKEADAVRVAFGEGVEVLKGSEWHPASVVSAKEKKITIAWEDETEEEVTIEKIRTKVGHGPVALAPPAPELEQKIIDRCEQLITVVTGAEKKFTVPTGENYREELQAQEYEINAACVKQQEYLEEVQTFLLQREVQLRVHQEVLEMICSRINNVQRNLNQKRFNLRTQIDEAFQQAEEAQREKRRQLEQEKEAQRRQERDRILQNAKTLVEEVGEMFQDIRTKSDMEISEEPNPMSFLDELQQQLNIAKQKHSEAMETVERELNGMTDDDFGTGDFKMQYMKFQARLAKIVEDPLDLAKIRESFYKKEKDELLEQVMSHLDINGITVDELFDQLQVDGIVTSEKFLAVFQTSLDIEDNLTLEGFKLLVGNYWYAMHDLTMTSDLNVVKSRIIKNVKPFDIFRVLSKPEADDSTGSERVRMMYDEVTEPGWVTCAQKGVSYCEPLPKEYTIKLVTVVTDKPELAQLKVIKRLKVGEVVKPISLPRASKQLLRVHGRCADGTEGWFTVVDNQKKVSYVKELKLE